MRLLQRTQLSRRKVELENVLVEATQHITTYNKNKDEDVLSHVDKNPWLLLMDRSMPLLNLIGHKDQEVKC
ncbi:hypothetical protein PSHT_04489 [Puccinia striiformis]|uniref:Uncharacterized protein n=1 Tax=Puccinia striiformis TaxID=27350 RepID=A0A2S4WCU3_9BASI|nr:hypothetical protein PSHT_04489 [Puccinia striiformis]